MHFTGEITQNYHAFALFDHPKWISFKDLCFVALFCFSPLPELQGFLSIQQKSMAEQDAKPKLLEKIRQTAKHQ